MIISRIISLKPRLVLIACVALMCSCATAPGDKTPETRPDADARMYLEKGDFSAAANEFLRLAEAGPDKAVSYRLQAADAWLKAGNLEAAGEILNRIRIPETDRRRALQLQLLQARLALYQDRPGQARALMPESPPDPGTGNLRADYHDIRAGILELQGNFTEAIRERIALQEYLQETDARRRNSLRIWNGFKRLDERQLQSLAADAPAEVTGWIELADIRQRLLSKPAQLEQAVAEWRRLHADHPAVPVITDEILATSRDLQVRPGSIALLLPFSGPYKRASEAIRDGLLAAWYAEEDFRPEIRIYDTDSLTITDDYRKAVEEGAEFIIGPLEKTAIRTLIGSGPVSVTTLALNQIDDVTASVNTDESGNLYQFALSPEHEVRQIAYRAIFEGFNRSLVITPNNQWGDRLSSTFDSEWRDMGGTLLESVSYNPNSQDFISPVKELLNIDSSEERVSLLRQRLSRNIKADTRTRKDADFIYMAAIPVNGRQIVPQFRFFRVDQTPIFSSSHIYTGFPDPQLDSDMDGVDFTDIPWVLRSRKEHPAIQQNIESNWSLQNSPYRRLYAFGVDAFRMISHLGRLSELDHYRYEGETGKLSMTDDGYIQRQLQWARFVNGRPVPLDIGNNLEQNRESPSQR